MKQIFLSFVSFLLVFTFGLLYTTDIFAQTLTVSGIILDKANQPVANTQITFTDPKTHIVIGKAVSDFSGQYVLAISQGTYDVTYLPPQVSGLTSYTQVHKSLTRNSQNNFTFPQVVKLPTKNTHSTLLYIVTVAGIVLVTFLAGFLFWVKRPKS